MTTRDDIRELSIVVHLDILKEDTVSDANIAREVMGQLQAAGFTVADSEAVTGPPNAAKIHYAAQSAGIAVTRLLNELSELESYLDDIQVNLDSIQSGTPR